MPVTRHMIRQPLVIVPVGTPPPWTPASIAGLVLWLDAADTATITASSNKVSQWSSKDSGAKAYTQGTAIRQPSSGVTTLNGLNIVDFGADAGGSDWDYLSRNSQDLDFTSGGFTTFDVVNTSVSTPGGAGVVFTTNDEAFGNGKGWWLDQGRLVLMQGASTGAIAGTSASIPTGWDYYTTRSTPATPLSIARVNGVQDGTTTATVGHAASTTAQQVGAYSTANATLALGGSIAEFLVYNAALSDADILTVEAYLKTKWGL